MVWFRSRPSHCPPYSDRRTSIADVNFLLSSPSGSSGCSLHGRMELTQQGKQLLFILSSQHSSFNPRPMVCRHRREASHAGAAIAKGLLVARIRSTDGEPSSKDRLRLTAESVEVVA